MPGAAAIGQRSYWLFPVVVPNQMQFIEFSIANGLNVTAGRTQTRAVNVPTKRLSEPNPDYEGVTKANWMLSHVAYLPCHEFLSEKEVKLIAKRFTEIYNRH